MNRWTKCDSCLPRVHLIFFKAWPQATLCLPPKYIPCSLTGANVWQCLAMTPIWKCVGDFWKVLFPPHLHDRLSSSWLPFSFFFPVFDAFYSTWKSKPVTTFMWKKKEKFKGHPGIWGHGKALAPLWFPQEPGLGTTRWGPKARGREAVGPTKREGGNRGQCISLQGPEEAPGRAHR